ncbi:selenocysteine lyase/cysteine desulfurase [Emydomyces testavorans]|uniref:Selenocysteine lyase/cysteine desulfurase n=1 Tax=Emydomyces testavorans TaxID=2070801 RepID=A0AAF0DEV6_9EURO|nr:selenocysteine lyase/cysteine desulfurase [Emydomyces testavorans]
MGSESAPAPASDRMRPFGQAMLEQFPLDTSYKNLNHGSFGTYPHSVVQARQKFQTELDSIPDFFIRHKIPGYLDESRAAIAKYLNVPTKEVVFVKNATTGVNLVLRNLVYKPGDIIVYFSCVYGACEKTIAYLAETTPLRARKVMLEFPCTHEDILAGFVDVVRKARADGLNVKVALFDIIVSQPGVRFPFEKMVEICREEGILSCIDGAHGVGHIPLDLAELNADFFVSNCHKWLFSPRGSAVFHVPLRNQHLIRSTMPTSWGFEPLPNILAHAVPAPHPPVRFPSVVPSTSTKSPFEMLFEFVATNDDTPYICIPAALQFRQDVCGGEARIMEYCEALAFEGGNLVARILGTEVLCEPGRAEEAHTTRGASQLRRCAMVNVRLPIAVKDDDDDDDSSGGGANNAHDQSDRIRLIVNASCADALARCIETRLMYTHRTMAPTFRLGAWLWVRLSAQIYLELGDFEWFGGVMQGICESMTERDERKDVDVDLGDLKITCSN